MSTPTIALCSLGGGVVHYSLYPVASTEDHLDQKLATTRDNDDDIVVRLKEEAMVTKEEALWPSA